MFRHHLFELLKTFTKKEVLSFKSFLSSSYFNNSQKINSLFKEILKFYPNFTNPRLTKENLCKKINRQGNYNDSTIRDALSNLLDKVQQFLLFESINKNKFESSNFLLSELSIRRQQLLFEKNSVKLEKEFAEIEGMDSQYLYNKYILEIKKFNFNANNNKVLKKSHVLNQFDKLTKSKLYLTCFFMTELICLELNTITYSRKYNLENSSNDLHRYLNILDMPKIIKTLETPNEYSLLLNLYMRLFELHLYFNNDKKYTEYKNLVIKLSGMLSADERTFHYSRLINYCIMKKRSINIMKKYDSELFEIYNRLLENEYYRDSKIDYLSTDLFRDILLHALSMRKFKWAENFVISYSKKVHPKETENMYNLGFAHLTNERGNLNKTLDYINKISINNFIYKFDVRNLLLKVFYDLEYTEESLSEIHSYREFLRNNKMVSDYRRIRLLNFLKYLEKMIFIKEQKSYINIDYIKQQLSNLENISYKGWLLERYEALEKNFVKN